MNYPCLAVAPLRGAPPASPRPPPRARCVACSARRRLPRLLAAAGIVSVLGACATPPVPEFEAYSEAFEEVRNTTYLLIQNYEAAIAPPGLPSGIVSAEAPAVFDPDSFRKVVTDTERRRRAVDAVVRYNEMMMALARGSSLESVKTMLVPLGGLLSLAGPQFSIGEDLVSGLLERALQARDNAEFLRAFRETTIPKRGGNPCQASPAEGEAIDSACAPILEGILKILARDTVEYYDAQRKAMNEKLKERAGEIAMAADPLFALGARIARPAPSTALGLRLVEIEDAYFDLARTVTPEAQREFIVPGQSGDVYTETTEKSLQALMSPVRSIGQRAQANRRALIDYHAALGRYVALLDRTLELLRETQAAAERPPDVFAVAERLAVIRTDVGRDAIGTREAILRAIAALQ